MSETDGCHRGNATSQLLGSVIRVVICSDVRLYREGLAQVLVREASVDVAGMAASAEAAVEVAGAMRPDVVLFDMSIQGSIGAIGDLAVAAPGANVLALAVPEREA